METVAFLWWQAFYKSIPHRINVWFTYLHLVYFNCKFKGKDTIPIDPMESLFSTATWSMLGKFLIFFFMFHFLSTRPHVQFHILHVFFYPFQVAETHLMAPWLLWRNCWEVTRLCLQYYDRDYNKGGCCLIKTDSAEKAWAYVTWLPHGSEQKAQLDCDPVWRLAPIWKELDEQHDLCQGNQDNVAKEERGSVHVMKLPSWLMGSFHNVSIVDGIIASKRQATDFRWRWRGKMKCEN